MTSTFRQEPTRIAPSLNGDALAYDAPFLIEKLLKQRIVDTPEQGRQLFTEVKRFLVLTQSDPSKAWEMYSLRVDEVWHQFVLFTKQYSEFCTRYFGKYIHHSPSNAPDYGSGQSGGPMTFEAFKGFYRDYFGLQLPDVWLDEKSIAINSRVFNDHVGKLAVLENEGMVELSTRDGQALLSVNDIARDSLAFIADSSVFHVRELPPDLTDEEKIALVGTLVEYKILRVAP